MPAAQVQHPEGHNKTMTTKVLLRAEAMLRQFVRDYGCFGEIDALTATSHAVRSAYLSIACALTEAVICVATGSSEESMSLFGMAALATVDLLGSLLVLYRWKYMSKHFTKTQIQRVEVYFSGAIGVMMGFSSVALLASSVAKLVIHDPPSQVTSGILVALYGGIGSLALFIYKLRVGRVLQCMVLLTDAHCSLYVSLFSLGVAFALMLQRLMWFADGLMGMVLAMFLLREAYWTTRTSVLELRAGVNDGEGQRLIGTGDVMKRGVRLGKRVEEVDQECKSMLEFHTEADDGDALTFTL